MVTNQQRCTQPLQRDLFGDFDREAMTPDNRESKQTRRESYREARPKVSARAKRALAHLRQCGSRGATREELGIALGIVHHGVASITKPLIDLRLVRETKLRRKTSTGRDAVVLVAAGGVDQ